MHASNPSAGGQKQEDPQGSLASQPSSIIKCQVKVRGPGSKKKRKKKEEPPQHGWPLVSTHIYTHICMYAHKTWACYQENYQHVNSRIKPNSKRKKQDQERAWEEIAMSCDFVQSCSNFGPEMNMTKSSANLSTWFLFWILVYGHGSGRF